MPVFVARAAVTNTDNVQLLYTAQPASPGRRVAVTGIIIGSRAAPADLTCNYEVVRFDDENATPAGTTVTARPFDEDHTAASSMTSLHTVGGAVTTPVVLLDLPVHQRSIYRFAAVRPSEYFWITRLEDHGIMLQADNAGTAYTANVGLIWEE